LRIRAFELNLTGPFDFQRAFRDVTRAPFQLTELVKANRMTGVFPVGDAIVGAMVTATGTVDIPHLRVEWDIAGGETTAEKVKHYFHDLFQTQVDLPGFYDHVAGDPVLAKVTRQLHGFTFLRKHSFFEALTTAIIDQQLNVAFAASLRERFIRQFGKIVQWCGLEHHLFPRPLDMRGITPADLRPLQFSRRKSEYILDIAAGLRTGSLAPKSMTYLDDDALLNELVQLRGVGRWTAEYVGMMAFGRVDYLPAADIGLQRSIQILYGLPERPDEAQVREMGETWKPYRGLATFYLWHALEG